MGLIREPDGVDFIFNSRPLTEREEKMLGEVIKASKLRNARTVKRRKQKTKHYEKTLGATRVGTQKMVIYPDAALRLINTYFGGN